MELLLEITCDISQAAFAIVPTCRTVRFCGVLKNGIERCTFSGDADSLGMDF